MTAIIILNWNGADDTIACLRSLEKAQGDFFITVADNGSADDSVRRINDYVSDYPREIHILEHGKNYGFAAGNNKAIAYASQFNPDAYLLLNNDTEVTPDFLTILEEFRRKNPAYRVLTPRINFYYDKQRIWNCGGRLFMGFRKYLFAGDKEEKARNPVMAQVGNCIRKQYELLSEQGISTILEWNPGNHFQHSDERTAKGFAWIINQFSQP